MEGSVLRNVLFFLLDRVHPVSDPVDLRVAAADEVVLVLQPSSNAMFLGVRLQITGGIT